jgi:hypothetical protein
MRYPRKLVFQLYLLFGHIYRQERGLNGINHESPIYVAHFKKKLGLYSLGVRFYGPQKNLDSKIGN